jgi:hypothetical protein
MKQSESEMNFKKRNENRRSKIKETEREKRHVTLRRGKRKLDVCEKKIIMCVYFFALKQNGESVKLNEKLLK